MWLDNAHEYLWKTAKRKFVPKLQIDLSGADISRD